MNKFLDYRDLPRILLEALIIVSLGVVLGLSIHHRLVLDVLTGKPGSALPHPATRSSLQSYPEPVDLATVKRELAAGALLLDARISELYRDGHLPGSISFPLGDADRLLETVHEHYPLDTPLITYCNGYGCPDSFDLAVRLLQSGYQRVMVFEGGYPEWESAGLPVARGN